VDKDKIGKTPGEPVVSTSVECYTSMPSVFWRGGLGDRKAIVPLKHRVLVCWWWPTSVALWKSYRTYTHSSLPVTD